MVYQHKERGGVWSLLVQKTNLHDAVMIVVTRTGASGAAASAFFLLDLSFLDGASLSVVTVSPVAFFPFSFFPFLSSS